MINSWKGFYLGNFFVEYFFFLAITALLFFHFSHCFQRCPPKEINPADIKKTPYPRIQPAPVLASAKRRAASGWQHLPT